MRPALGVSVAVSLLLCSPLREPTPGPGSDAHPAAIASTLVTIEDPPAGLTRDDWRQIRRSVEASEYHATRMREPGKAPALEAPNRQQAYRTTFRRQGIEIVPKDSTAASWRLGMLVTGYGYEDDVRPLQLVDPQAEKERVEYCRGPLREWYVNRPVGLEQGFELDAPQPERQGRLAIVMEVDGDLDISLRGEGISFTRAPDDTAVRYAGLKAWDAAGRPLQARMEVANRKIRLVLDPENAQFPITVDPTFVHEAQLFGQGDVPSLPSATFGTVAVSGDTVVVGAATENTPAGAAAGSAYVFVRSGISWITQQKLVASDSTAVDVFGNSVALDGDTAVIGARFADTPGGAEAGAAYVFVRTGGVWTEQQKLVASDGAGGDQFGFSVSLSGDTAVVGAWLVDTAGGADAGAVYVFVRAGTLWTEQQKLLAPDGALNDHLGWSLSLSGDTAVAGAVLDDTPSGPDAGSAYVFVRTGTTWSEQQKLTALDGTANATFGHSVSVSADTLVIGAATDGFPTATGSAYVFVRSGTIWTQEQKLLASDASAGDGFGTTVSLFGDTAVVGAYVDDTPAGGNAGSAYVFTRSGTTWTEQQKLTASDAAPDDNFGYSVSLSGDTVVVGSILDDTPAGPDAGSAYVFVRSGSTWSEQQKLLGWEDDIFGASVAVDGDTAVVGAPLDDTSVGAGAGSVYVFVRSGATWTEQQKLLASDNGAGDRFGTSVSVSGDTVVVGASLDDTPGGANAGSAYVFVRSGTTWTEQQKVVASDGAPDDGFGISVSIFGDTVAIGSFLDNTAGGVHAGSAYVFVRSGTTWTEEQKLLASDGSAGDEFGYAVSLSGDTIVIGAHGDDSPALDAGSAYVFVRSGTNWTQQQKVVASDGAQDDLFGTSVSISGDTIAVGAYSANTVAGPEAGAAYVFVGAGGTWSEQQKLLAGDGAPNDFFGLSVALSGETAVVGAPSDDTPGGSAAGSGHVFVRSGTTWSEQQKLLAPDGAPNDNFGSALSVSIDTVAVGAPLDATSEAPDAGSAHVFRALAGADLGATKTDGQTTAVPGEPLIYTIEVSNAGPDPVAGALVTDLLPPALLGATWTCSASPGSSCASSGSGNINDTANLAVGGTATYVVTGTVAPGATGTITNAVTVTLPGGVTDPNPANNSAADVDTLTPEADLDITKTDSADPVSPGDPLTYTLSIINAGPSDATSVTVVDTLPAGVTFLSSNPPSPTCVQSAGVVTCTLGPLAAGSSTTVTIDVIVNGSQGPGVLVNTATASGAETDPDPSNNTASASTTVKGARAELAHGTNMVLDLTPPAGQPAQHFFLVSQKPSASYEVVVDATSGDIGGGTGPLLQRMAPDGTTVLQDSAAVGAGPSRSLRWRNAASAAVEDQTVRVRSAQCGTDCGPEDVYRLRAYETTYAVPRFNNSGTQITVLVLQNPTNDPVAGEVYFWAASGAQVAVHPFALAPKTMLVLNTATVPGAEGVGGAITVAHDGRYGDLLGKTVALEPATGFSFDSMLEPRRIVQPPPP